MKDAILVNSYLMVMKMGGIAIKILKASMEMVLFPLEICGRYIICIENNLFSAVFEILPPNC